MKHLDFVLWMIGWGWFIMRTECEPDNKMQITWRLVMLGVWISVTCALWRG